MKIKLVVNVESDIDTSSGYPCSEGWYISMHIEGLAEVLRTKRVRCFGFNEDDRRLASGLAGAKEMASFLTAQGNEVEVTSAKTEALLKEKEKIEKRLAELAKMGI
jgi:hypothetical protein